jgi:DNA repair protein RadD
MAMELIHRAHRRGESSFFLAPRHELLRQAARKLDEWLPFGYGMITSNERGVMDLYQPVQVASVDTLVSRVIKRQKLVLPPVHNVLLDEAHLYMTQLRTALIDLFPTARIYGFTATPGRADGRALNLGFEVLHEIATVKELTAAGYLVPMYYKAPSLPDLKKARELSSKSKRDYTAKEMDEAMLPLIGDIPENWLRYAAGRRTVVFAHSVGNSVWLAQRFRELGVAAEHCDGTAEGNYRDAVFERFESGETQVLCNVDLATYGYDLPAISCVVIARPTTSVVRYLQMAGRGLRPEPSIGKKDCLLIDHAGCVHEHGFVTEDRHWTLAGVKTTKGSGRVRSGKREKKDLHLRCKKCGTVFGGALTCPDCGYYFERAARGFQVVDGELVALEKKDPGAEMEKRQFYAELLSYCELSGYQPGWAAYAYQAKYKVMPPREWARFKPLPVSATTERFVKFMRIRRARSKQKRGAA